MNTSDGLESNIESPATASESPEQRKPMGVLYIACGLIALAFMGWETYGHENGDITIAQFVSHIADGHGILLSISVVLLAMGAINFFPDSLYPVIGTLKDGGKTWLSKGAVMTLAAAVPVTAATSTHNEQPPVVVDTSLASALVALDERTKHSEALLSELSSQMGELLVTVRQLPSSSDVERFGLAAPGQVEQMDRHMLARFDSLERQLSEFRTLNSKNLVAAAGGEISTQVAATSRQLCFLIAAIREANNGGGTLDARLANLEGRMGSLKFYEEELAGRNIVGRITDFFSGRNLKRQEEKEMAGKEAADVRDLIIADASPDDLAAISPAAGPAC